MTDPDAPRDRGLPSLRRWALWSLPLLTLIYILAVDLAALLGITITSATTPPTSADILTLLVLAGLGVAHAELCRQIERLRRALASTPHVDMTAAWIVAGVLLLPPGLAALLPLVFYAHLLLRTWGGVRGALPVYPHRQIFNSAAAALSTLAAAGIVRAGGLNDVRELPQLGAWGLVVVAAAVAGFMLLDTVLIGVGAYIVTGRRDLPGLLGGLEDNALELANCGLGLVTAVLAAFEPGLVPCVFLVLLVLHRSVLVKQLEVAATTDEKTGLFNSVAWQTLATRELARAQRGDTTFGVLMIDLDHFKRINDQHGHLAGDAVLKAVAEAITSEVRDYDAVGRFGGEEFVVLLPGVDRRAVVSIAERIRATISALVVDTSTGTEPRTITNLSASIGVAVYPDAGTVVEHLIHAADTALYHAKNSGRNRVVSVDDVA